MIEASKQKIPENIETILAFSFGIGYTVLHRVNDNWLSDCTPYLSQIDKYLPLGDYRDRR